ncbi:MAG: hypothetical protein APF77_14815 [Clostridia bacterium BRH_c25]|nr:MAG: hypothetical protein APF77_14815 [Clostridia bacterium BRH_c25]
MKNTNKIIAMVFVLVFMFTVVMSSAVFAAPGNDKANGKDNAIETEKVKGSDKANEPDREEKTKVKETEENNTAETDDSTVETDESTVEEEKAVKEKDKVMEQKKVLMKQLIEVRKSGDTEAEAQLLAQVNEYKEQLRLMVRNRYTEEEMAQLEQAAEDIEAADPTLEVLPVEMIISKGKSLKLDIPPVIKDGKVLVPIRTFSQAYGAEVQWDQEEHAITIIKDDIEIVLKTDSSIVFVNGIETDLGIPVTGINGRNVMPVGFLAEKLGLKVEVDEDGTVEVDDEEDADEEDETADTNTEN